VQGKCGKKAIMDWIYISPHLDDVALSLGGLLWDQSQAGLDVSIWTICAGDPPPGNLSPFAESLHRRWGVGSQAIQTRRDEDIESCKRLGVKHFHFEVPDCIYRRSPSTGDFLYDSEDALWGPLNSEENGLVQTLSQRLQKMWPPSSNVVLPLTLGSHVDHTLTRDAGEAAAQGTVLEPGSQFFYYADYPYVLDEAALFSDEKGTSRMHTVSPAGMRAWQDAIAAHSSQINTFWTGLVEMRTAICSYYEMMGGIWMGKYPRT
jgi:LmbE family N-acetylglucosaminyl deacetylase